MPTPALLPTPSPQLTFAKLAKPAATGGILAALAAPQAEAQIVGYDLNFTVTTSDIVYLDFDNSLGNGYLSSVNANGNEFEVGFRRGNSELPYFRSRSSTTLTDSDREYLGGASDYGYMANELSPGMTISASRPMQAANQAAYLDRYYNYFGSTFWGGGGTSSGFIGFSFLNADTTVYGFVELNYNDDANTMELVRFAYDVTGAPIEAGAAVSASAVPEPASAPALMGLLAGSAAAFGARRRRRPAPATA